MSLRVLFYVQHLLGIGHLKRAAALADAMVRDGLQVRVVLGGSQVPGIRFDGCARVTLPAIRSFDSTFSKLVTDGGEPLDDDFRDRRRDRLLYEFATARPDVVLIEQFPFGRRAFRFELMPLIAAARSARPEPRLLSSVRDIVVRKRDPARNDDMVRLAQRWFDLVLVHGDPELAPLTDSLPEATALTDKLCYTGYVCRRHVPAATASASLRKARAGTGEVIVSVGGGAVGEALLRCALQARPISSLANRPWRLIAGPNLPAGTFSDLVWAAPDGVIVNRWRDDMPILLRNCIVSVSQAGYNTVCDLLQASTSAVLVPFADGAETEQTIRAEALAKCNAAVMVHPNALTPKTLAEAIATATSRPPMPAGLVALDGAAMAARVVASRPS